MFRGQARLSLRLGISLTGVVAELVMGNEQEQPGGAVGGGQQVIIVAGIPAAYSGSSREDGPGMAEVTGRVAHFEVPSRQRSGQSSPLSEP